MSARSLIARISVLLPLLTSSCGGDEDGYGQEGDLCGGGPFLQAPPPCAPELFCDYEHDECGSLDGGGTCVQPPSSCPPDGPLVHGCDGNTYANTCEAHRAGTDVSRA